MSARIMLGLFSFIPYNFPNFNYTSTDTIGTLGISLKYP